VGRSPTFHTPNHPLGGWAGYDFILEKAMGPWYGFHNFSKSSHPSHRNPFTHEKGILPPTQPRTMPGNKHKAEVSQKVFLWRMGRTKRELFVNLRYQNPFYDNPKIALST
jgi:hypothetical protein